MIEKNHLAWKAGIETELEFWERFFSDPCRADSCARRLDPHHPLQPRPEALLPQKRCVSILDVGAGPLTYLGKKAPGRKISITAIDPLADEYEKLLAKHRVRPLVRTVRLAAEEIPAGLGADRFDLVFARNAIDHSYNPEMAILGMLYAVKPGGYVLLEHRQNEANREGFRGFHQWNFSLSRQGHFIIKSKSSTINMTLKHAAICEMTSEVVTLGTHGEWMITRIRKVPHDE